jgi:DNA-binding response OmpR family regulator
MLVDDNHDILDLTKRWLDMRGYCVHATDSMKSARKMLSSRIPDLIMLDIILKDGNGLDLCQEIREFSDVPILFLTCLGESSDVVKGLRAGGDDYLPKPFDFEVLEARIDALLRRTSAWDMLTLGNLRLDALSGRAFADGEDLMLTPIEFSLLLLLAKNTKRYVSQNEIYHKVWASDEFYNPVTLKQHIYYLRHKMSGSRADVEIESIRNTGYRLIRSSFTGPNARSLKGKD